MRFKKVKRMLSVILSSAMVLTTLPMPVGAEEEFLLDDVAVEEYFETDDVEEDAEPAVEETAVELADDAALIEDNDQEADLADIPEIEEYQLIMAQPQDVTAELDSKVVFAVEASGVGLTYQWQKYDAAAEDWTNWENKTGSKLSVRATAANDGLKVRAVVTDINGVKETSEEASLTVAYPTAGIAFQPESIAADVNTIATFAVTATGEVQYQWEAYDAAATAWAALEGKTADTLNVEAAPANDGMIVRCVVTAGEEAIISDEAQLTVVYPQLTVKRQPASVEAAEGAEVSFKADAAGYGVAYQWQVSEAGTWADLAGKTAQTLYVTADASMNGNVYRCVITDITGAVVETAEATLTVNAELVASDMPAQEFTGAANRVRVYAAAPEGAFPADTDMVVTAADAAAVQAAADAAGVAVEDILAVDISFVKDGVEIEPATAISVTLNTIAMPENAEIVHVDDDNKAEVVEAEVAGREATFESDAFSVYAIVTPDNRTTVNFYYNGSIVNTQIIKGSETLYDPSSEVTLPEGTQFKGWHYGSQTGEFKTIDDLNDMTLTGTVNVYAETFRAYSVQYKDGDTLLKNEIVELTGSATNASYTVNQAYEVTSQSETFVGWMVQGTETVYANGTEISVTGNLVLVPKTAEGYWLTFNENGKGATYVSPVFVENGKSATKPADPTRPGYTFAGWYTAAEGGSAFAFGTLSANTIIYAHWTMNATANYTVNYWKQKISDDVDAATKTYDFAEQETKSANSGSKVSGSNSKSYTGFYYDHADTNVTVEPDGSTVVNVYYNRKVVTVYFYGNNTSINNKEKAYAGTLNGVTKTIRGLYEAPLKDGEWDATSHGWYAPGGGGAILLANYDPETAGYDIKNSSDGKGFTTYFYKRTGLSATLYYYNEQADGTFKQVQSVQTGGSTTIHEKFAGYDLYKKWSGQTGTTGSGFNKKDTYWTPVASVAANFFDTQYQSYMSSCSDGDSATYKNSKTYVISKLKSYPLTYMVNSQSVKTETIKYTVSLAGKDAFTPSVPEGQMFVGWFADPAGTVAYDFSTATMPIGGVTVYAKFEPIQYRVFLNTNGGALPDGQAADFRVDYGNVVQDSALQEPLFAKAKSTLIGWYTDEAMTQAYNFATHIDQKVIDAVGDNTYREDEHANVVGSLNLYAKWRKNPDATSTFTVEYDAADGTNAPVDEIPYNDGASATVSSGSTAPSGLVFDHWVLLNADGSESGNTYAPGETFTIDSAYSVEKDGGYVITLKAVYVERHTTFLKYDVNGGGEFVAGTETEITGLAPNSDVTLLAGDAIKAKTGYEFIGWNQSKTAADAGIVEFEAGQTVGVDNMADTANTLYAVYNKYFYVYHTGVAGGNIQTVNWRDNQTYNLATTCTNGTLYGGYYHDYENKEAGTVYNGTNATWDTPYEENGTAMHPVIGTTYYVKEVPDTYLRPTQLDLYRLDDNKTLNQIHLLTVLDDGNYSGVKFWVGGNLEMDVLCHSIIINPEGSFDKNNNEFIDADETKVDPFEIGVDDLEIPGTDSTDKYTGSDSAGIGMRQYYGIGDGEKAATVIRCQWTTPDNVVVTGAVQRVLTIKQSDEDKANGAKIAERNVEVRNVKCSVTPEYKAPVSNGEEAA